LDKAEKYRWHMRWLFGASSTGAEAHNLRGHEVSKTFSILERAHTARARNPVHFWAAQSEKTND
jgi:hypothetical protein